MTKFLDRQINKGFNKDNISVEAIDNIAIGNKKYTKGQIFSISKSEAKHLFINKKIKLSI